MTIRPSDEPDQNVEKTKGTEVVPQPAVIPASTNAVIGKQVTVD